MVTVLFLCTGNVHRSVLAERLLAKYADGALRVASAGTEAAPGAAMDPATRSVLQELGGSGAEFASRRLTEQLVETADLVLGMEPAHREAAVRLAPLALHRCFTLREFVRLADGPAAAPRETVARAAALRGTVGAATGRADTIADPWGQGYDVLRSCAAEIDGQVRSVRDALCGHLAPRP